MDADLFKELEESIRQMKAIESGEKSPSRVHIVSPDNEVALVRKKLKMTQRQFAILLGTPLPTVQGWEQGRRQPQKAIRILLRIAAEEPEKVLEFARSA